MLKYVDVHSHILHHMDDGPEHLETALRILEEEYRQNVETVIVTPHFKDYERTSIDRFLDRRARRVAEIKEAAKNQGIQIPEIRMGAEVFLSCDLSEVEGIEKLAIEGTRYILVEMPYTAWNDWMFDSLYALMAQTNLIPVIAHIERYGNVDRKKIEKLSNMDVYFQINADSLLERGYKQVALKMIRQNLIQFMGSDVHNLASRPSRLEEGYRILTKKISGEFAHYINVNGHLLLDDHYVEKYSGSYHKMAPKRLFSRLFG
ncbi:MAG: hypothetical protein J6K51_04980 [Clostridia bacterium]|nr:hypothetical protein [Clostridia bacterium]